MGRSSLVGSAIFVALLIFQMAGLAGCGSNAVHTTTFPVPATVNLSPTPNLSMEIGTNQAFTAGLLNSAGQAITEPLFFFSRATPRSSP